MRGNCSHRETGKSSKTIPQKSNWKRQRARRVEQKENGIPQEYTGNKERQKPIEIELFVDRNGRGLGPTNTLPLHSNALSFAHCLFIAISSILSAHQSEMCTLRLLSYGSSRNSGPTNTEHVANSASPYVTTNFSSISFPL